MNIFYWNFKILFTRFFYYIEHAIFAMTISKIYGSLNLTSGVSLYNKIYLYIYTYTGKLYMCVCVKVPDRS